MKSIFFLFFFFIAAGVFAETQFGSDATVAFGGENTDITSLASIKAASLSSEANALTAVYFLFKGDKDAVGFTFIVDCIEGEGEFYFSIVKTSKSKKGDVREIIFPIKDLPEVDGKKVVKIINPKDYMDSDGNIEVHISVVGGYLTLNSISVEFVKDKTESEFKKETNLVLQAFAPPPGLSDLFLCYHHGEVWLWGEYYGKVGFKKFDCWWDKKTYPPKQDYIFHFNQEVEK